MASVTFYLNKNKITKNGLAPIILQFDHKGKRFKYYTGEKIEPNYWSKSKNSYIKPSYYDDSKLNDYLIKLKQRTESIVRDIRTEGGIITADDVKKKLLASSNQPFEQTFFPLFNQFIEITTSTKAKRTISNFEGCLKHLEKYKEETEFSFRFEDIDSFFYKKYVDFLITEEELSNNTIGKEIKLLKTFLNWTTDLGYNKNYDYKKFKILREEIEIVYLTDDELNKLYNLKIDNKQLYIARDLFCLGCFTGLRFSDISQIEPSMVLDGEIRLRTQKTKDILAIPLLPQAKAILKKYELKLPYMSNQMINKYLKDLCEQAEINQEVTIHKYRGATRIDQSVPKYKLITSHTARRTFITLSLEKGIRPEVVMSITGHKDYRTFKAYIKIVDIVKKEELLKAWI